MTREPFRAFFSNVSFFYFEDVRIVFVDNYGTFGEQFTQSFEWHNRKKFTVSFRAKDGTLIYHFVPQGVV